MRLSIVATMLATMAVAAPVADPRNLKIDCVGLQSWGVIVSSIR